MAMAALPEQFLMSCFVLMPGRSSPAISQFRSKSRGTRDLTNKALEAADYALKSGRIDLNELETLLNALLANQLYDFYQTASGERLEFENIPPDELHQVLEEARLEGAENREAVLAKIPNSDTTLLGWVESHPVLVGLIGVILAVVLAKLLGLV